jgi:regulator of ribonuclease activity A
LNPQQPIVTADIYDVYHASLDVCDLQLSSFGQRRSFYGRCVTVKTFEDHLPVLEALQKPGNGNVLVVDAGGSLRVGVMGDRVAEVGVRNGWTGAIIYGAIRDSAGIDQLDFGVKALGATARRTWVHGTGHHGVPLAFGGARFASGAWVYADGDCVLISANELDLAKVRP